MNRKQRTASNVAIIVGLVYSLMQMASMAHVGAASADTQVRRGLQPFGFTPASSASFYMDDATRDRGDRSR